ncbi:MAG TPA: HlyD family efflux transporter periplasmic adaptor subunit [Pirellulales bacterium]
MKASVAPPDETLAPDRAAYPRPARKRRANSGWAKWLVALLAVLSLGAAARVGYDWYGSAAPGDLYRDALTTPAMRGDLLILVSEEGNIESARNVEIKCQVPGPLTILEIVPDGSVVHQGDVLVRLDGSYLEDALLAQEVVKSKAEAAKIAAERTFNAAQIAVDEYRLGTFVQEMKQLEADITVAKQNQASAENQLAYSEKMYRSGYVTRLDVESKQFAVEQSRLTRAVAERKKFVLEKFTSAKMLQDLISQRDAAEALMNSAVGTFTHEVNKLNRYAGQLEKCTIVASQDGMVVYANDTGGGRRGGGQEPKIEQGAQVNQFQSILKLPDLRQMQVKTLVHEDKVDELRVGMRARIRIRDAEFQGEIKSIANQPEATSRWSNNVKEYATIIKLDGEPEGVKPGMSAAVDILVGMRPDVIMVPVQCVADVGGKPRAWVKTDDGVEQRDLALGRTDDTYVEVVDGLKEGEPVLLNVTKQVAMLPQSSGPVEAAKVDADERFGTSRTAGGGPGAAGGGEGRPGDGRPSGGPPGGGQWGEGGERGGGQGGGGQGGGGRGRGGAGGGRRRLNFKELDKNGDGKVSLEEMPEDRRERFGRMDTNGDGFIDQDEQKAMAERMRQFQQQGGRGGE